MSTQTFNISIPKELVKKLDEHAKRDYSTRSDYIKRAVISQIRTEEAVSQVFDNANAKGKKLGITSEQDVYDAIDDKK